MVSHHLTYSWSNFHQKRSVPSEARRWASEVGLQFDYVLHVYIEVV